MHLLPKTSRQSTKWFIAAISILYFLFALANLRTACFKGWSFGYWAFGFWSLLAIGVWRLGKLAMWTAIVNHWILLVVIPAGLLNPGAAMDGVWGFPPKPASTALIIVLVISGVNLIVLFTLKDILKAQED
jgi:hypothetical protein